MHDTAREVSRAANDAFMNAFPGENKQNAATLFSAPYVTDAAIEYLTTAIPTSSAGSNEITEITILRRKYASIIALKSLLNTVFSSTSASHERLATFLSQRLWKLCLKTSDPTLSSLRHGCFSLIIEMTKSEAALHLFHQHSATIIPHVLRSCLQEGHGPNHVSKTNFQFVEPFFLFFFLLFFVPR